MPELKLPTDLSGGLFFINGKRCSIKSAKSFDVIEPRIGKAVASCPEANEHVVDEIVNIAAKARQSWSDVTALDRGKVLRKVAELIRENLEELAKWEVKTNGKPIFEARLNLKSAADSFDFYGGIAPAVLQGETIEIPGGDRKRFAYTRREPFGVVGCIGAWNFPFVTCVWKVAPALAAGNAVVYKPSQYAPHSPVILGEILTAAGLPDGVYNVIQGATETGVAICEHPLVRKLTFTGSLGGGQGVQKQCAAKNVKPCTLELGGKSGLIVFDDAEIDGAVATAMMANFLTQGEVCTNATRVFVQEGIYEKFTNAVVKEANERLKVGDPLKECTRIGATINEAHLKRVLGYIESAVQEGGKILRGGKQVHPDGVEDGYYLDPAIIVNLKDESKVMQEEIFGACMLITPFKTEDEVIKRVNDTNYGLANGIYTSDLFKAHRIATQLEAGTIFINCYNCQEANVPFGGYKDSGYGRENCIEALKAFSQVKSTYVNLMKQENPF